MSKGVLGKLYRDGEVLVRQGEVGDQMFVIQEGEAEILIVEDGEETRIRVAGEGEVIGEMAVFEHEVRSATVRALGDVRALTLDKRNFLRQIAEDPSIAFHIMQTMSHRIRELSNQLAELKLHPERGGE
jgi:CRP/FNR family transcriptional regulator